MTSRAVLVVVLAVVLTSCGGSKPQADPCASASSVLECRSDTQTFAPDDACRLIRISEAESILGRDLSVPGRILREKICFNVTRDVDKFQFSFTTDGDARVRYVEATNTLEGVEGIGSEAAWDEVQRTLHVWTGSGYLWIRVPPVDGPRTKAVKLAEIALRRAEAE